MTRWYLCDPDRTIVRVVMAECRSDAVRMLAPSPLQYVTSAASYAVPLPSTITDRAVTTCAECHKNIVKESWVVGQRRMHRSCYEKHLRDTRTRAEREADNARRRERRAAEDARKAEEQERKETERRVREARRNGTIRAGVERRQIKRTLGIKHKRIVPN